MLLVFGAAVILLIITAVSRFVFLVDPFTIKIAGIVLTLFGFIFVFGVSLPEGGAKKLGGSFLIAGILTIIFI